jgi:hypothetical protein
MREINLVLVLVAALVLNGCVGVFDWQDNVRYGGHTRTDSELAYDSSVRVANLLAACGTPECLAAKAKIEAIGAQLIRHVNAQTVATNIQTWYAQEDKLLDDYSAAKREAYLVLVDSGWVAPAGTDGTGSWDATWWDFSSP